MAEILYGNLRFDKLFLKAFRRCGDLDLQTFRGSIGKPEPPDGLSFALQALWWDAKGDWEKAHELAQERDDQAGMRVHAYLHRKEGDHSNAAYWYRRCRASPATGALENEWEQLVLRLLAETNGESAMKKLSRKELDP